MYRSAPAKRREKWKVVTRTGLPLLVSLTALALSIYDRLFERPSWEVYWPERIGLYQYETQNGIMLVRAEGQISYLNKAHIGHAGAVVLETAILRVGSHTALENWNAFGRLRRTEANQIAPSYDADAGPLAVEGQAAVSHTTFFMPSHPCSASAAVCTRRADTITAEYLNSQMIAGNRITVDFNVQLFPKQQRAFRCTIRLGEGEIQQWRAHGDLISDCVSEG